jgi:hypothetical protein
MRDGEEGEEVRSGGEQVWHNVYLAETACSKGTVVSISHFGKFRLSLFY